VKHLAKIAGVLAHGGRWGRVRLLKASTVDEMMASQWVVDAQQSNGDTEKGTMCAYGLGMHLLQNGSGPACRDDVFGDGRIVLLPVPGHTIGMTAALVALDDSGEFLLASDAIAVEANLTEGYAPKNSWDLDKAVQAIDELRKIGERGATIIFGHDDAQWQALRKGADFYA
jgi:hypothetical protein